MTKVRFNLTACKEKSPDVVFLTFLKNIFWENKKKLIFAAPIPRGTIAQLVEQRTENPCVPGSIPGGTTSVGR